MAQSVATLKAQVVLDAGGLVDGLNLTKKEMREAAKIAANTATDFEKLALAEKHLERLAKGSNWTPDVHAKALSNLRKDALAKEQRFDAKVMPGGGDALSGLPGVGGLLSMATPMGAVTAAIGAATAGFAAFGTGVAIAGDIVMSRIEAIDNLGDAAERLGMTTTQLSTFHGAAFLGDVDPSEVDSFVNKMITNLGKESSAFTDLGLDIDKLKKMDAGAMFEQIATAIAKIPNKADQFAALTEIGGKGGTGIANLVENFVRLKEEAMSTGAIVGEGLAGKVSDADNAMKRAKLTAEGWANTLTDAVAPAITLVVNGLTDLAQSREGTTQAATNAGGFLGGILGPLGGIIGGKLGGLAGGAANDAKDSVVEDAKKSAKLQGDLNALKDAAAEAAKKEAAEEAKLLKIEQERAKQLSEMIQSVERQTEMLGKNAAEQAALKMAQAGGDDIMQEAAADAQDALDFERQRIAAAAKQAADEQRLGEERMNEWKSLDGMEARSAIRQIDEAERIKDAMKTDREKADEATGDAAKLHAAGLLTDDEMNKSIRLQADALAKGQAGQVGVAGAEKGTAAGRMAVLETKQAERQSKLLEQIVDELRKQNGLPPIVVKEMGE